MTERHLHPVDWGVPFLWAGSVKDGEQRPSTRRVALRTAPLLESAARTRQLEPSPKSAVRLLLWARDASVSVGHRSLLLGTSLERLVHRGHHACLARRSDSLGAGTANACPSSDAGVSRIGANTRAAPKAAARRCRRRGLALEVNVIDFCRRTRSCRRSRHPDWPTLAARELRAACQPR
jgi:hypothetical protein